jgi:hypothetical protein
VPGIKAVVLLPGTISRGFIANRWTQVLHSTNQTKGIAHLTPPKLYSSGSGYTVLNAPPTVPTEAACPLPCLLAAAPNVGRMTSNREGGSLPSAWT